MPSTTKCHYCENMATRTLIWLKDKNHNPARIQLPWCGCDLMTALRRFWASPYQVVEGRDYAVEMGLPEPTPIMVEPIVSGPPIVIKEFTRRLLFGLVQIDYLVEDRRPSARPTPDKYKHFINLRVLRTRYNWTFHTQLLYDNLPFEG